MGDAWGDGMENVPVCQENRRTGLKQPCPMWCLVECVCGGWGWGAGSKTSVSEWCIFSLEVLEGQKAEMICSQYTHNICSGGWTFSLKTRTRLSIPIVLNENTCHEAFPLTPHSVKFLSALKAEQALLLWQTALQSMDVAVCISLSNTPASPRSPTGFDLQKKLKKKISRFNLLMSTSTRQ